MFSVEFDANIALSIWWFQAVTSLQTAMLAYSGAFLLPTSWGMPNIGRTETEAMLAGVGRNHPNDHFLQIPRVDNVARCYVCEFVPGLKNAMLDFTGVDFISASRRFYAAWACFNIFPKPISHHRGVRGLMVRVCFQQYMVYQQYINQRLLSRVWGRVVWANLRAMSPAIIVPVNYTLRSIPLIYHQREVCFIVARHWAVRSLPMVVLIYP